jgi:hypothetical protein
MAIWQGCTTCRMAQRGAWSLRALAGPKSVSPAHDRRAFSVVLLLVKKVGRRRRARGHLILLYPCTRVYAVEYLPTQIHIPYFLNLNLIVDGLAVSGKMCVCVSFRLVRVVRQELMVFIHKSSLHSNLVNSH